MTPSSREIGEYTKRTCTHQSISTLWAIAAGIAEGRLALRVVVATPTPVKMFQIDLHGVDVFALVGRPTYHGMVARFLTSKANLRTVDCLISIRRKLH
jgi:hypothetical protein